jgi:paraquat-inducible protein B
MVLGVAACVATVVFFGGRTLKKETVAYKTYFDESVQGLEVGSPVKYRGVNIGNVSDIDLAGDKRHVAVTYELGVKVLNSLGLAVEQTKGAKTKLVIPPDLRVQLASAGITGVKFMQLDFFDVKTNPPIPLPFEVAENYIPAVSSMMKNLEDSVVQAVDRFPELANQALKVLSQLGTILAQVDAMGLPLKVADAIAMINKVLTQVSAAIVSIDPGTLSKEAQQTLTTVNVAVLGFNQLLGRVNGEKGLAASLLHTSESMGSMAQNANHVGPALEDALRDVQGAAVSVQRFADSLELDPDMLLKGRARQVSK